MATQKPQNTNGTFHGLGVPLRRIAVGARGTLIPGEGLAVRTDSGRS